ncbi:hypothetical protein G6L59_27270, partial [Agrobacterium tumefaciens]|uniref:hypothetical protein n=1 Tax=Agrobacterium tumefaciens TaxID=358 RepID=UPI001572D220
MMFPLLWNGQWTGSATAAALTGRYHPGRYGTIKMGPKVVLGYFVDFHPRTQSELEVSGAYCGFVVS